MITTELFIILKLFTTNNVSWWWIILFLICDGTTWRALREIIRRRY